MRLLSVVEGLDRIYMCVMDWLRSWRGSWDETYNKSWWLVTNPRYRSLGSSGPLDVCPDSPSEPQSSFTADTCISAAAPPFAHVAHLHGRTLRRQCANDYANDNAAMMITRTASWTARNVVKPIDLGWLARRGLHAQVGAQRYADLVQPADAFSYTSGRWL